MIRAFSIITRSADRLQADDSSRGHKHHIPADLGVNSTTYACSTDQPSRPTKPSLRHRRVRPTTNLNTRPLRAPRIQRILKPRIIKTVTKPQRPPELPQPIPLPPPKHRMKLTREPRLLPTRTPRPERHLVGILRRECRARLATKRLRTTLKSTTPNKRPSSRTCLRIFIHRRDWTPTPPRLAQKPIESDDE